MTRGKRRPRLLQYARDAADDEVQQATKAGFALLVGDSFSDPCPSSAVRQALAAVSVLKVRTHSCIRYIQNSRTALRKTHRSSCQRLLGKRYLAAMPKESFFSMQGIGPATASAILSAFCSSIPFMSDEALLAVLGKRDYTVAQYMRLLEAMRSKARELSETGDLVRYQGEFLPASDTVYIPSTATFTKHFWFAKLYFVMLQVTVRGQQEK